MNPAAVAKANFAFGRMNVHIHVPRRDLQKKHGRGMAPRLGEAAVGLAQRMLNKPVTDGAAVQKQMLVLRRGAG